MKNNYRKLLLLSTLSLFLTSCGFIPKPSNTTSTTFEGTTTTSISSIVNEEEQKILEIYHMYLQNGGTMSYEEWLATIKGEKGDQGDKGDTGDVGPEGPEGPQGEQGTPGYDGTSVHTGHGIPSSFLGKVGDSYIDLDTWDYYIKSKDGWTKEGNISPSSTQSKEPEKEIWNYTNYSLDVTIEDSNIFINLNDKGCEFSDGKIWFIRDNAYRVMMDNNGNYYVNYNDNDVMKKDYIVDFYSFNNVSDLSTYESIGYGYYRTRPCSNGQDGILTKLITAWYGEFSANDQSYLMKNYPDASVIYTFTDSTLEFYLALNYDENSTNFDYILSGTMTNLNSTELSFTPYINYGQVDDSETTTSSPTINPNEKIPLTIKVWGSYEEEAIYDWAFNEYNADPNRKYDASYIFEEVNYSSTNNQLAMNGVDGASLYFFSDDDMFNLLYNNFISYVDEGVITSNFTETAINTVSYKDKYIGYPVQTDNGWFAYYDNRYLNEEDVTSLETILAKAEQFNKKVYLPFNVGWYTIPSFFSMADLYWEMDDSKVGSYKTTIDSEESIKSATYLNNLFTTYMKKGILCVGQEFDNGYSDSIYTWNGYWAYDQYLNAFSEDNLGLSITPTYKVENKVYQTNSFISSKILGINNWHSEDKIELANEIAELMTSKEGQLKRYEKVSAIPTNIWALEDNRYLSTRKPTHSVIERQMAISHFHQGKVIMPVSDIWYYMEEIGKCIAGISYENDENTGLIANWSECLNKYANYIRELTY